MEQETNNWLKILAEQLAHVGNIWFNSSISIRCTSIESSSGHDYQYGPTFMLSGGGAALLTGICKFCGKKIEYKIEGLLMPLEMMTQRKGDLQ
jgi:hypothetical protein